jgi:hypothetical protein
MTRWLVVAIAATIVLAVPGAASAAWYAKFEGIDGDVQVSPSPAPASLPQGAGSFVVTKAVDAATPKLLEAAVKGKVFKMVVLRFSEGGRTTMAFRLMDVVISSYATTGGGERFTIRYQSLRSP